MNSSSWFSRLRHLTFLLKAKGIKYTYNCLHFHTFWVNRIPFLIRLLYRLKPYPSYLEIEVTTRCNLRCVLCEHTYWDEPPNDMPFEDFQLIVDQFPGLKWLGLTGIGESFLHRDFLRMLEYVKRKQIIVELYDTFYFIDEDTGTRLIEMQIDKMLLSIDAATKETYERLRVGSSFDRVIRNVERFMDLKAKMRSYFPEVSFHYVVNKLNCHEIPEFIELTSSISKGERVEIQFSQMLHDFSEIQGLFMRIPDDLIETAEETARRHNIHLTWNLDVPQRKPPMSRCVEWTMPFVFVTGHVIPCCAGNEANRREFQKQTALGNVFEKPFRDIWHGEKYTGLRRMLSRGKTPPACINCTLYRKGS